MQYAEDHCRCTHVCTSHIGSLRISFFIDCLLRHRRAPEGADGCAEVCWRFGQGCRRAGSVGSPVRRRNDLGFRNGMDRVMRWWLAQQDPDACSARAFQRASVGWLTAERVEIGQRSFLSSSRFSKFGISESFVCSVHSQDDTVPGFLASRSAAVVAVAVYPPSFVPGFSAWARAVSWWLPIWILTTTRSRAVYSLPS